MPDTRLLEALRATLLTLENSPDVSPNDSEMAALKSILLRRIADIESQRDAAGEAEQAAD